MSIDPMIKKFAESLFRGYKPILPRQSQKHNTIAMYSQGKLLGKYVLGEHDPNEEREGTPMFLNRVSVSGALLVCRVDITI